MPIVDLFSKRQKRLRGEVPDVYEYERIPQELRVQVVHVFQEALGSDSEQLRHISRPEVELLYAQINRSLAKEYGLFTLGKDYETNKEAVLNFILREQGYEKFLDATEFILRVVDKVIREDWNYRSGNRVSLEANDAIEEINDRFKEHGVGYEYVNGEMIRIDTQIIHNEAIKPALALLRDKIYSGANQEFLKAFDKYKGGDNKQALVEALKALESTLKAICDKRGWTYNSTDTASKLINVVLQNGLIPGYMQGHFDGLRPLLESVATPRNKMGGHGQGSAVVNVSDYFARFALNMTASAIVMLVEAEKALP
ncbi:hypothetical protein E5F05_08785 [Deinococcus metallilatus]|uniref:Abortive infection protein-like C-terminal domain-containing protein n=1 Tax=Deinococcus metallilatus TaxID=1211322 RepID=A0AAJ5JY59_9DEIO|nr:hypothetical protein [Deinococcus metallilatus]MBB5295442.1 hypothetical protein [Deinococcus metallilatus]QBY08036.1 hypothetical protein E5F05_08785 [Deinococcus metallilatus]RXJ12929.1 hypothetical protein ERJ73_07610 [Deinococcus metallilatus]TLK27149.1 hypothetical protein FCS05_09705 [Deinococcus metallilatus]GMA16120.1 hypothetical protein GCM10025871_24510 [Deinococcus metallilatus]